MTAGEPGDIDPVPLSAFADAAGTTQVARRIAAVVIADLVVDGVAVLRPQIDRYRQLCVDEHDAGQLYEAALRESSTRNVDRRREARPQAMDALPGQPSTGQTQPAEPRPGSELPRPGPAAAADAARHDVTGPSDADLIARARELCEVAAAAAADIRATQPAGYQDDMIAGAYLSTLRSISELVGAPAVPGWRNGGPTTEREAHPMPKSALPADPDRPSPRSRPDLPRADDSDQVEPVDGAAFRRWISEWADAMVYRGRVAAAGSGDPDELAGVTVTLLVNLAANLDDPLSRRILAAAARAPIAGRYVRRARRVGAPVSGA